MQRLVRFYLSGRAKLQKVMAFEEAVFEGFWLGLFGRAHMHSLDQHFYDAWISSHAEAYNRTGLTQWETTVIDTYFKGARNLFLLGAGGGREVLALSKRGFEVDAYECHCELAALANRLLAEEGVQGSVSLVPRDLLPPASGTLYDGAIIGWGAYMLIQRKARRIALLSELRPRLRAGAPVLLSFFHRSPASRRYRVTQGTANLLRWLRREERVELGDRLDPNYVHFFTKEEIRQEVSAAGYDLAHYSEREYGHAVALASCIKAPAISG